MLSPEQGPINPSICVIDIFHSRRLLFQQKVRSPGFLSGILVLIGLDSMPLAGRTLRNRKPFEYLPHPAFPVRALPYNSDSFFEANSIFHIQDARTCHRKVDPSRLVPCKWEIKPLWFETHTRLFNQNGKFESQNSRLWEPGALDFPSSSLRLLLSADFMGEVGNNRF